jgi:hypothetical protein
MQLLRFFAGLYLSLNVISVPTYSENVTCVHGNPHYCGAQNNCVSFVIGSGTGCQWMCSYCADQLGTNNYYFTDQVCSYQSGGCVGNPQSGKQYTCCSA